MGKNGRWGIGVGGSTEEWGNWGWGKGWGKCWGNWGWGESWGKCWGGQDWGGGTGYSKAGNWRLGCSEKGLVVGGITTGRPGGVLGT